MRSFRKNVCKLALMTIILMFGCMTPPSMEAKLKWPKFKKTTLVKRGTRPKARPGTTPTSRRVVSRIHKDKKKSTLLLGSGKSVYKPFDVKLDTIPHINKIVIEQLNRNRISVLDTVRIVRPLQNDTIRTNFVEKDSFPCPEVPVPNNESNGR